MNFYFIGEMVSRHRSQPIINHVAPIVDKNDSGFVLRNAFELWASSIQAYNENFTSAAGLGDADDATGYFADMTVHQLARDVKDGDSPKILKSYRFYNVFPSNIAAIDLDFGSNDAIEEFTVELQTQYWTPVAPGADA
jgi:hypothetical protein